MAEQGAVGRVEHEPSRVIQGRRGFGPVVLHPGVELLDRCQDHPVLIAGKGFTLNAPALIVANTAAPRKPTNHRYWERFRIRHFRWLSLGAVGNGRVEYQSVRAHVWDLRPVTIGADATVRECVPVRGEGQCSVRALLAAVGAVPPSGLAGTPLLRASGHANLLVDGQGLPC